MARELLAHPDLPRAFKTAAAGGPDPAREALAVLVRARHQVVDRHRRLLNEAEALLNELPGVLAERLPGRKQTPPRLAAAARLRLTGDRVTDLRLRLLRAQAREERALAAARDALERELVTVLRELHTTLPALFGLGPLGAAELLVQAGDPRRFRSADAFAASTGTAPIPASSAEPRGHPVHHRLSRFGNRRLNSVLHIIAMTRLRTHPETQAFIAGAVARGKSARDALRIVKRRLARCARCARTARRVLPALLVALALALLAAEPALAQGTGAAGGGAEQAATNFTTLMTNVARAAAAGFFFGGLVLAAIGGFGGMPKVALMGKSGAVFGVVLFLAQRLYTFATSTAQGILG